MNHVVMRGPLAAKHNAAIASAKAINLSVETLGLKWSDPRVVANGQWRVSTASPDDKFWQLWRAHKEAIITLGVKVSKNAATGKFEAVRWLKPTEAELSAREMARDASRASTGKHEYPGLDGKKRYPYQNAGIDFAIKKSGAMIGDDMGLGKALSADQLVLTASGWRKIGEIKFGDQVYGRDGRLANVLGVYPQGEREMHRLTLSDGFSVECDLEHLWAVKDNNGIRRGRDWNVITTAEMLRRGVRTKSGAARFCIPLAASADRPDRNFYLCPYIIGAMIGDGSMIGSRVLISVPPEKDHVRERVTAELPTGIAVTLHAEGTSGQQMALVANIHKSRGGNPVIAEIKRIGLNVRSAERFIPDEYMFASTSQRVELLHGLMDTDGSARRNRICYHTKSERLAYDVAALVQSLSGEAIVRRYDRAREGKGVEFQVNVRLDAHCPFSMPRKAAEWAPAGNRGSGRRIASIERIGRKQAVCIKVDNADHLYVCQHHIVTHNTSQAIGIIDYSHAANALVICPASLKLNWQRELNMWLTRNMRVAVVTGGKPWPDADIYIINYDILHSFDEQIKAREWDVVVIDEAHMLKSPKSRRTRMVTGNRNLGIKKLQAKRRVALTGTPIPNRPAELWPIIHYLDPQEWNSWPSFAKKFCGATIGSFGMDAKGATNLEELQDRLRETVMIRRLKSEVLTELPAKTRQLLTLPSTGAEKVIAAELDAYKGMKNRIAELRAKFELAKASAVDGDYKAAVNGLRAGVAAAFTEMARQRKAVAIAKIPTVLDQVEAAIEGGKKVIVFVHHREVHDAITHHFGKKAVGIIGGQSQESKQQAVDSFQKDARVQVFVGSIMAAGVGITLTASSHVIMGELDWVPGNMVQAEDRAHRIGQRDNVLAQWLVLEGSLDSHMAKTLMAKAEIIEQALDREHDGSNVIPQTEDQFATTVSVFETEAAATREVNRDRITKDANKLTPADCADVHEALIILAGLDGDHARTRNDAGFARIDVKIGHELASQPTLTTRQAALGIRIAKKYHRQLGDMGARITAIWQRLRTEGEE